MAAQSGDGVPGPADSVDPDRDPPLSVELLMSRLGLSIEQLTRQLVDQASVIMNAQERLRRLLNANRSIVQELSLPAVLHRIVDTARDVAGARYAALGVIGADGLLEQFLHVGLDEDAVEAIGELPQGTRRARCTDRRSQAHSTDPDFRRCAVVGLPGRPSTDDDFPRCPDPQPRCGVREPLSDRPHGRGAFTSEDEELVLALAATAGVAIENARLYEESRRRQEWLRASGEISRQLLDPEADYSDTLHRIATSVKRLASADVVTLVRPTDDDPNQLEVVVATGAAERELMGLRYRKGDSIAWQAMQQGHGVLLEAVDQQPQIYLHLRPYVPVSQAMALPLMGETVPRGAIVAGRTIPHAPFTDADLDMAETFAGQAAIALELSDARADQQRLGVLEDRDRIARDLHDHVIQRLFAAGLSLQSIAATVDDEAVDQRLTRTVDELDETIRQIRTTIFELQEESSRSLSAAPLLRLSTNSPRYCLSVQRSNSWERWTPFPMRRSSRM